MHKKITLIGLLILLISGSLSAESLKLPKMKPGDWESVVSVQGIAIPGLIEPKRVIYCLGDKQQDEMVLRLSEINQRGCDKPVIKQRGAKYNIRVDCNMQGMEMRINSEINILSDAEVRGSATMESAIGMSMDSEFSSNYKGPCAQGRKPGDFKELG